MTFTRPCCYCTRVYADAPGQRSGGKRRTYSFHRHADAGPGGGSAAAHSHYEHRRAAAGFFRLRRIPAERRHDRAVHGCHGLQHRRDRQQPGSQVVRPASPQTPDTFDNLVAAHIHAAATTGQAGTNAGVVWGFFGSPDHNITPDDLVIIPFSAASPGPNGETVGGRFTAVWNLTEGAGGGLAGQLPNILAGRSYINFHTTQFGGGEIRGQITARPRAGDTQPARPRCRRVGAQSSQSDALRRTLVEDDISVMSNNSAWHLGPSDQPPRCK